MSESLKGRATILAQDAAWQAQGVTDTEVLAALIEATVDVVRQAETPRELLDRWKMSMDYLNSQVRADCKRLGGPA